MMRKIICMPNFDLPQKVDLDIIRNELKQAEFGKSSAAQPLAFDSDNDEQKPKPFNVLPLHSPPMGELKTQLSLRHNEYLACKFNKFLTEKPKLGVHLRLYHEIKSKQKMSKPRRMKLNGKFYDVDHKLAPAPFLPDPRQYCKKRDCKKVK